MKGLGKVRIKGKGAGIGFALLSYGSAARADILEWIDAGNEVGQALVELLIWGSLVAGIAAFIKGLLLMRDKGGARGEEIGMGRILFHLGGGIALIVIWLIIVGMTETLGGSQADIGKQMF